MSYSFRSKKKPDIYTLLVKLLQHRVSRREQKRTNFLGEMFVANWEYFTNSANLLKKTIKLPRLLPNISKVSKRQRRVVWGFVWHKIIPFLRRTPPSDPDLQSLKDLGITYSSKCSDHSPRYTNAKLTKMSWTLLSFVCLPLGKFSYNCLHRFCQICESLKERKDIALKFNWRRAA